MLERVKDCIRKSDWSLSQLALVSKVPLHFISDVSSGAIEKGTSDSYKNKKTIDKHLKALDEFFKPIRNEQKSLERRDEKANNERSIIANKCAYNSNFVLGGVEYAAQYNTVISPVKMLIYDIEVSPLLAWTYNRYNTNVLKVEQEQQLLSFAYLELIIDGKKTILDGDLNNVKCITLNDVGFSQEKLTEKAWELFNNNQVIIGYNNKAFDDKMIYRYFMKYGLPVPTPIKQLDLFKEWKKIGKLSSNGLNAVNRYINHDGKTEITVEDVWYRCIRCRDKEAFEQLREYNKQDVVLTYNLMKSILPFMKNYPNLSLLLNHPLACPKCGHINDFEEADYYYTNVGRYNQYRCKKCNSYLHGRYQDSTLKINDKYIDVRPILK